MDAETVTNTVEVTGTTVAPASLMQAPARGAAMTGAAVGAGQLVGCTVTVTVEPVLCATVAVAVWMAAAIPGTNQRGSESRVKILTLSSDGGHDLGGSRVLHELALREDAAGRIVLVVAGVASERVVARGSLLSSKTLDWRGERTGANVPALSAVWGSPPTPAICTASARVDALLSAAALGEAGSWCWITSRQHLVER